MGTRPAWKRMVGWGVAIACAAAVAHAAPPNASTDSKDPSAPAATLAGHAITAAYIVTVDVHAPLAARVAALHGLHASAEAGNGEAQQLLGALYLYGHQHPGSLVHRDPGKAGLYLSNAAVHGRLLAMAAMAELDLQRKRTVLANVWALLYEYYSIKLQHNHSKDGYLPALIYRARRALPAKDFAEVKAGAVGMINRYDASIRAGYAHHQAQHDPACQTKRLGGRRRSLLALRPDAPRNGMALFLVGIDAQGTTRRVIPVLSLPTWRVQARLAPFMRRERYNTAPHCGALLRFAFAPIELGDRRYEFSSRP